jgi:hypothetical protein
VSLAAAIPVGTTPVSLFTTRPGMRTLKLAGSFSPVDLYYATSPSQLPLTTSNGTHVPAGTTVAVSNTPGVASNYPFTVQVVAASTGGIAYLRSIPF